MQNNIKINTKIDPFYYLLGAIFILIATMLIFTFRGVFNAFSVSTDIGEVDTESELKINESKLKEALNFVGEGKETTPLVIDEEKTIRITPTLKPSPTGTQ